MRPKGAKGPVEMCPNSFPAKFLAKAACTSQEFTH